MRGLPMKTPVLLLFSLLLVVSCDDDTPDRGERYGGKHAPCEVTWGSLNTQKYNEKGFTALEERRLWEYGPFPYWNTSPASGCRANPKTPEGTLTPGVELYISFPAKARPTDTKIAQVAQGPFPVVVFTHANNDRTCNIFERYFTLMDHLASWGYIAVSVDSTEDNCSPGTRQNIENRSLKQRAAIAALEAYNDDPESPFYQKIDLSQIVLAGHSRGGGASIVSLLNTEYNIVGILDYQGVDSTAFGYGAPDVTVPVLSFSASKDVDLNYPYVEPQEAQLKEEYTWVTIVGGIHAWTADTVPIEPDDYPAISQKEQHDIQEYFTTAFLLHNIGTISRESDTIRPVSMEQILFSPVGAQVVYEALSEAGVWVRWNTFSEGDVLLDDFNGDRSAEPDWTVNLLGGENSSTALERSEEVATYTPNTTPVPAMYNKHRSRLIVPEEYQTGVFRMDFSSNPPTIPVGSTFEASVKGDNSTPIPTTAVILLETPEGSFSFSLYDYVGPVDLENRLAQVVIPFDEITQEETTLLSVTFKITDYGLFIENPRIASE